MFSRIALIILLFCPVISNQLRGERPNIIIFLADDMRDEWHGALGGKVLTPNFDRFVQEGTWFTNAYITSPICTPSRYTINTGQYASRAESLTYDDPARRHDARLGSNGQRVLQWNTRVTQKEVTLADALRAGGYRTGIVGKCDGFFTPEPETDFKSTDMNDPQTAAILRNNQEKLAAYMRTCGYDEASHLYKFNLASAKIPEMRVHNFDWTIQGAMEFIDRNRENPFFLMVSMTGPHAPDATRSMLANADRRITEAGLLPGNPGIMPSNEDILQRLRKAGVQESEAGITWLDDALGALLDKVESAGLWDNTIILYINDHNDVQGKGSLYEGGTHTHMALLGACVPATAIPQLAGNVDIAPTVLDLCGVDAPDGMILDGRSLLPLLKGKTEDWRDELYLEVGLTRGLVTSDGWKYIAFRKPPEWQCEVKGQLGMPEIAHMEAWTISGHAMQFFDPDQLYYLKKDPKEQKNMVREYYQTPESQKRFMELKVCLSEYLAGLPGAFGEFKD